MSTLASMLRLNFVRQNGSTLLNMSFNSDWSSSSSIKARLSTINDSIDYTYELSNNQGPAPEIAHLTSTNLNYSYDNVSISDSKYLPLPKPILYSVSQNTFEPGYEETAVITIPGSALRAIVSYFLELPAKKLTPTLGTTDIFYVRLPRLPWNFTITKLVQSPKAVSMGRPV